jgi:hypothetical protein
MTSGQLGIRFRTDPRNSELYKKLNP